MRTARRGGQAATSRSRAAAVLVTLLVLPTPSSAAGDIDWAHALSVKTPVDVLGLFDLDGTLTGDPAKLTAKQQSELAKGAESVKQLFTAPRRRASDSVTFVPVIITGSQAFNKDVSAIRKLEGHGYHPALLGASGGLQPTMPPRANGKWTVVDAYIKTLLAKQLWGPAALSSAVKQLVKTRLFTDQGRSEVRAGAANLVIPQSDWHENRIGGRAGTERIFRAYVDEHAKPVLSSQGIHYEGPQRNAELTITNFETDGKPMAAVDVTVKGGNKAGLTASLINHLDPKVIVVGGDGTNDWSTYEAATAAAKRESSATPTKAYFVMPENVDPKLEKKLKRNPRALRGRAFGPLGIVRALRKINNTHVRKLMTRLHTDRQ